MGVADQSVDILVLMPGMIIATSMVWVGLIGFLSGSRVSYVNVLFACLFGAAAWYFAWISLVLAGALETSPRLLGMPMLAAAFLGPFGWLFVNVVLDPVARFRRAHLVVLFPALFGVGVAVYTFAHPERVWPIWTAFLGGRFEWTTTPVTVLFALHGIQLVSFCMAAVYVAARAYRRETDPRRRVLTFHVLGLVCGALAAAVISAFLPLGVDAETAQAVIPSLTLPSLAVA